MLMFWLKDPLPFSLEYAKDQRNRGGVSKKQFLNIFKGVTYLTYPAREFIYAPSYPYKKLTKILTSEGHIFDQQLAFYLLEVSCPINILLHTKNDKHKQRVFKSSEHKCAYFYPDLRTNNGHKRQVSTGCYQKKSRVRFLRVTPHDLCLVLYF